MFSDYRFLYVEDDALSRQIMQMIMQNAMQVEQLIMLNDSKDFMNQVRQSGPKPDIFLLDIHVRPYTGFEMLEMLREDPDYQDARIIALTASVMNEEIEQLQSAGFDGTIAKPLNLQTFPELIQRVIDGEPVWYVS